MIAALILAAATAKPPRPDCNHDVVVLEQVQPRIPNDLGPTVHGYLSADVCVEINFDGSLSGAEIVRSTGDARLDQLALAAARASRYLPKSVNCVAIPYAKDLGFQFFVPDACNHDATATSAVPPEFPRPDPRFTKPGKVFTIQVAVTLDSSGKVASTAILQSSGDTSIDKAAATAANKSTYQPAMRDCKAIGSTSIFKAEFQVVP